MKNRKELLKGLALVITIAYIATLAGKRLPSIGAGGFGIIIGMVIASFLGVKKDFKKGVEFSSKFVLHFSIVLLGASINLSDVFRTGVESFPVIIVGISTSFMVSNIVGKILGLNFNMRNLIGAGTGICGGSAIAALSSVIKPKEEEISYSLSIIFLFNILAVFIFPALGRIFNMTQNFFGIFAGSAINDTSSVVAAGYILGDIAGQLATIVKLTRTMAIIPVVLIFSLIISKNRDKSEKVKMKKVVPWFISGFVLMSLLRTVIEYIPGLNFLKSEITFLAEIGKFCIVIAISAIGLKTDLKSLKASGTKPFVLGLFTWLAVISSTLLAQILFLTKK